MNWVFISICALTVGQTALCGFSLPLLISYIGRGLFLLRGVGSVIPYTVSAWFERANIFFVFLGVVFAKGVTDYSYMILTLLCWAIMELLYIIDDRYYLYVVMDDDEDEGAAEGEDKEE